MITGVHALVFTQAADKARAFFKDVLGLRSVDAGQGWLIFALPPTELAVHPSDDEEYHELYLMCDDIHATMADLTKKGVTFGSPIADRGWGLVTSIDMPGGGTLGLYEPRHLTAHAGPR
jgi:catechol 2,3-dioxygenase-like lactoylglutathione lyase family enzyme